MQQDRRHQRRRADRQALRDALANHGHPPARGGRGVLSRDAGERRRRGRGQAPWQLPARATVQPGCEAAYGAYGAYGAAAGRPGSGVSCKTRARGAALLDVMFTLVVLMAGMQGFSRWQAAGGMPSAELASPTRAVSTVAMALPAQIGSDAWHVRRHP